MSTTAADTLPSLDIAIATWRSDGLARLCQSLLPVCEGLRYVVSWQNHGNAPVPAPLAERADIIICRTEEKGLSANRNNALSHCTADIILNGDDDLDYDAAALTALRTFYATHPRATMVMTGHRDLHDRPAKAYPSAVTDITDKMPRGLWCATFELSIRRDGPLGTLRFDKAFGPGAPLCSSGEDEMFLLDGRHILRGSDDRVLFVPLLLCRHRILSHTMRAHVSASLLRGQGAVIRYSYPLCQVPPRLLLKALRTARSRRAPFLTALRNLLSGALRIHRTR